MVASRSSEANAPGGEHGDQCADQVGKALAIMDVAERLQRRRVGAYRRGSIAAALRSVTLTSRRHSASASRLRRRYASRSRTPAACSASMWVFSGHVAFDQCDRGRAEEHLVAALAIARGLFRARRRAVVSMPNDSSSRWPAGRVVQQAIAPRDPEAGAVAAHVLVLVVNVFLGPREQLVDHLHQIATAGVGGE